MLNHILLASDTDSNHHKSHGALPEMIRLQRLVSYFGDVDGINGLIKHVGDDKLSCEVLSMLWDDRAAGYRSYRPFAEWEGIEDEQFKDLMGGLMNLDPKRRLTAREALRHCWFKVLG